MRFCLKELINKELSKHLLNYLRHAKKISAHQKKVLLEDEARKE